MPSQSFRSALDDCIAALHRGESVDACLARYPRHAERLRPLLTLAGRVQRTPPAVPRPWAQETAWNTVRERAAVLRSGRRGLSIHVNYGAWMRPLAVATALVMAVLMGGGATTLAAQSALPDSPLYRVKLATEDVRLWFVADDSHEAEILMDQSNERIDEIMAMVQKGKPIPENVLSVLHNRNQRAADILDNGSADPALMARLQTQSAAQEELLIALWPNVSDSARTEYTEAVALVHNVRLQNSGGLVFVRAEDLAGGILNISGQAVPIGEGVWSVGGVEVHVDQRTIGSRDLFEGATARVVAARSASGDLNALSLSAVIAGAPPTDAVVSGAVEEVTSQGIRVAGQFIPFTTETLLTLNIKEGQRVEITLGNTSSGVVAASVKRAGSADSEETTAAITFEGSIEGDVKKTDEWKVGGLTFTITSSTRVDAKAGKAQDGARVLVEASVEDGQFRACSVTVLASASDPSTVHLAGIFEGAAAGEWLVSGLTLSPPAGAQAPATGSLLVIDATRNGTALTIGQAAVVGTPSDAGLARVQGTIMDIDRSTWNLELGEVRLAATAVVSGEPIVGARTLVWGHRGNDGTIEVSYARILDTSPVIATPTAEPTATPGPTPSPAP